MSDFPLYTSLLTNLPDKDLTPKQKSEFIKKIEKMDLDGHELLYALIKTYCIENESNTPFTVPYNGKFVKNNVTFDLASFPLKLRQLLYKFSVIHVKKMKEDLQMSKGPI